MAGDTIPGHRGSEDNLRRLAPTLAGNETCVSQRPHRTACRLLVPISINDSDPVPVRAEWIECCAAVASPAAVSIRRLAGADPVRDREVAPGVGEAQKELQACV